MQGETPKMTLIMYFVSNAIFGWIKPVVTVGASWLVGTAIGFLFEGQPTVWYQEPAVVSAVVAAMAVVAIELVKWVRDNQKNKQDRGDKDDERHQTANERIFELTLQERDKLLEKWRLPYEQQIKFLDTQRTILEIGTFEARFRSHRLANEINRLHNHIHQCHQVISQGEGQIPDFELRYSEDLMQGLAEELEKFKRTLERQAETIHPTGGA